MLGQLLFVLIAAAAIWLFTRNVMKIRRNIMLGKDIDRTDHTAERWKTMARVALGQSKMMVRPIAGFLHILIYVGFVIINIEMLEIVIDGIFGTHRIFSFLGSFYGFLIGSFEFLALGVLTACVVFLIRRNIIHLKRFSGVEMKGWPVSDANYILIAEILLMTAFLTMNAADYKLQLLGAHHYIQAGSFPVSAAIAAILPDSETALIFVERLCWWSHIVGIFAFLNYIPYSKHFHIVLAFPNTWYSNLNKKGKFTNMQSVTNEVKAMLDPSFTPPATDGAPGRFGAKDVTDLNWVNLMNAYSCTECGRCTSNCPANMTGKLLSPRKIMMDTRDRLEEVGKNIDKHGKDYQDGKALLGDYITQEELWACTTCNACTEACPVNIDPLAIIVELRRYLVMEESNAPASINNMFGNVENNQAPWKYSPSDRTNWINN
ncbi:4Fe-4S dicluster domain-containing protein [Solitalea canadensis]|uniref:4Fe-4S ferredoxin-type domain-containing protein n=1 Tax=Solitalea canadensis (strain ATCC 29591 / DSM 3403 / JCM 21819 / LMG 8368 / NBRC 15130 / NCIMB 12057 / USAM 9D) TaxID=929556 RepID=H8KXS3_SOLCM|nr:4Fe-4S dicluster domain-containing protein [Solitalea canadensis]AFD05488.1 hypothetical protein Solca_0345 [Solitalea canadensis DSM 3403]